MKTTVAVGEPAPSFVLNDQSGAQRSLADFLGHWVVLYFYPEDFTFGCTRQACAFRDHHEDFTKLDAVVLGISSDEVTRHNEFVEKYALPFTLLADVGGAVRECYGVPKSWGLFDGRITFVIDPEGIVRHIYESQTFQGRHVTQARQAIERGIGT